MRAIGGWSLATRVGTPAHDIASHELRSFGNFRVGDRLLKHFRTGQTCTCAIAVCEASRYNLSPVMQNLRYALVAYVKSPAGEFVEDLRKDLHTDPGRTEFAAHLTLLPPRTLSGSEASAIQLLEKICGEHEPFEVTLGAVETFIPVTPTVFIRVETPADMNKLHAKLNTDVLLCTEEWPYIPHLTIAKMSSEQAAQEAFEIARQRWEHYSGSRRVLLEKLTFVREDSQNHWIDLAPIQLGRRLVSR